MIAPFLVGLSMLCVPGTDGSAPPLNWSPSGEWIAFAVATPSVERSLADFPLFPDRDEPDGGRAATSSDDRSEGLTRRVWAVRLADGRSRKIGEGPLPLTSPGWSPDGNALAFARVVEDDRQGALRWEVVVAFEGDDRQVIAARPLGPGRLRGDSLMDEAVAWDPTGAVLAVPDPQRLAVDLIDAEDGTILRTIEGARLLSFGSFGGRIAFYRARDDRWELVVGRLDGGPEDDRPIDLLTRADQAPEWTSDGQSILYLKVGPPNADGLQARFFSYRIDADGPREIKEIESPSMPGERIDGTYLSIADDGLDQFFVIQFSGRPSAIAYHQGSHPIDRIHPLAGIGTLGAPSLSPSGERIAFRYGHNGTRSLPGLFTIRNKQLTPIAPDDALKAAWIATLAGSAEPATDPGQRPTRLPVAAEIGELGPSPATYKKLADLGNRLLGELEQRGAARSLTAAPSLYFSYLAGDYRAADRKLDEVSPSVGNPDQAVRLLGLRAQLCLARGDDAEARDIIEFVRNQYRERVARVESDGSGGYSVSAEGPEGPPSWPDALWSLHQDRLGPKPGTVDPAEPEQDPSSLSSSPFEETSPARPAVPRSLRNRIRPDDQ